LTDLNQCPTVFFVGENQITPFPKQSATGSTRRRGEKGVLDIVGALDGPLKVLQVAVGDLTHDCARRGLYGKYKQALYKEPLEATGRRTVDVERFVFSEPFSIDKGFRYEQRAILKLNTQPSQSTCS
jgi:hypothetical protein